MKIDHALPFPRKEALLPVPEGSVLAPLLFSVFVNDVPMAPGVEMLVLVDDTAVYAAAVNAIYAALRLQRQLDACVNWVGNLKGSREYLKELKIGPVELPWSCQVKYLGLNFDAQLIWRLHAQSVRKITEMQIHRLWRALSSPAMIPQAREDYSQQLRVADNHLRRYCVGILVASHRKSLKIVLDRRPWLPAKVPCLFPNLFVRQELGAHTFYDTVERLARTFYARAVRNARTLWLPS